ncbi:NAD-dependent dehydratase [Pseudomonas sp. PIC25]|uniref:UDP-glucose 4-epimerase family protein n=1 Tax=Pseudomonas sp. PIC25 TaxID=1958773 RepID=UPI000BABEE06|nr:SDR family oxidoreductase [Pseudomonas sp. PIC25]PAU54957.1 NAD-dependent dehydratase [Pseudomonas sp. PIC25]
MTERCCLVTGASGFVGAALVERLGSMGRKVCASARSGAVKPSGTFVPGDLDGAFDWSGALQGVDSVVHCAARVHVLHERDADPLSAFRAVNVDGTLNLARQAAVAGIRRFVFISSVKVLGEGAEMPYDADTRPAPFDAYALSKLEAEQGLRELVRISSMELVIIRPPLVYGPGVKANFLNLMRWLHRGVPLPLGRVDNRRSFVALDNLIDLILLCLDHPAAANQTFLVSDGEDLSTADWLRRLGVALGRPARLLPVPASWLEAGAGWLGKGDVARRLCGSLQVDIGKTRELLGWTPPVAIDEALRRTAEAFLEGRGR